MNVHSQRHPLVQKNDVLVESSEAISTKEPVNKEENGEKNINRIDRNSF